MGGGPSPRIGLNLKVAQKQILTPGLVQMVSVLALNKLELREMINREMVANPVLEEVPEDVPSIDEVDKRTETEENATPSPIMPPVTVIIRIRSRRSISGPFLTTTLTQGSDLPRPRSSNVPPSKTSFPNPRPYLLTWNGN